MKDRSFSHGPFAWALKGNGRERRGGAIHSAGSLHVRLWTPLGCPRPQPLCCFPVAAVHSAPWGRLHVGGWRTCSENLVSFHFMLIVSVIDKGLKSADSFFVFNLNGLVVLLHTGSSVYFAVPLYVFYF